MEEILRKPAARAQSAQARHTGLPTPDERHYTVQEIAKLWHMGRETVRTLFVNEPGVIQLGSNKHRTMRIPHSVFNRVHQRLMLKRA